MGQVLFQLVTQSVNINFGIGCEIRAKVVLSADFAYNDGGFFDVGLGCDKLLYFGKLDSQTAKLDLTVKSAENKDIAVPVEFCIVAGAVHSLTEICDKRLSRLFRQIAVALCNANAAHIKLAYNAEGSKIAVFVNNVFAVI